MDCLESLISSPTVPRKGIGMKPDLHLILSQEAWLNSRCMADRIFNSWTPLEAANCLGSRGIRRAYFRCMRFQLPQISVGGSRGQPPPSVVAAIDMGTSRIKFVRVQRRSGKYVLTHFGSHPVSHSLGDGQTPQSQMAEVFRACMADMGLKRGHSVASISARSTLIRHVEFPQMPLEDMKKALKLNSSPYLHQQYTNYNFDCHILPPRVAKPETTKGPTRLQVLVGGASTQDVLLCRDSLLAAGLVPLAINLAPVAMLNAFE